MVGGIIQHAYAMVVKRAGRTSGVKSSVRITELLKLAAWKAAEQPKCQRAGDATFSLLCLLSMKMHVLLQSHETTDAAAAENEATAAVLLAALADRLLGICAVLPAAEAAEAAILPTGGLVMLAAVWEVAMVVLAVDGGAAGRVEVAPG
jgi:hypothetical protein